jgi:hypothetical protein
MNTMISNGLAQDSRIKRIRNTHGSLGAKFFELVGEPSATTVTEVRPLRALLEASHPGVKDIDVVRIMKRLGKAGFGRFIPGRGSNRSRFEWSGVSSAKTDVAPVFGTVDPAVTSPRPQSGSVVPATAPDTHRIMFRLRKDFTLDLQLPSDLSAEEAQRLTAFILALPAPR